MLSTPAPDVVCQPCDDGVPCPTVSSGPPGPQGPAGSAGANGEDGVDSFSITNAAFTVPVVGSSVTVMMDQTTWMVHNQPVYVGNAGVYAVTSTSSGVAQLTNTGAAGNASLATVIAAGQTISPSGVSGPSGSGTVNSVALAVPSWLLSTGGPITNAGTLTITGAPAQTQNMVVATPDSIAGAVALRALVANDIPSIPASKINTAVGIAGGGTGQITKAAAFDALSPTTTKGDLIVNTGAPTNVRLAVGADGNVITADSSQVTGLAYKAPAVPLITALRNVTATPDVMVTTDKTIGFNVASAASETLLAAPANGREVTIKDESGSGAVNNITINAGAGDTIQGAPTAVITTNYGYRTLYYRASSKIWFIIASA